MSVAIVAISHSPSVARGVVDLIRELAPTANLIAIGGGVEDGSIGIDDAVVTKALEHATQQASDVVVVMDMGAAISSVQVAVAALEPALSTRIHLSPAPFIEGCVAAAVTAAAGGSIEMVLQEAKAAAHAKGAALVSSPSDTSFPADTPGESVSDEFVVTPTHGLHARPAARLVQALAEYDATVELTNATTGAGPARGTSLTDIATLGAMQGHTVVARASGDDAELALAAIRALATENFGDSPAPPEPVAAPPSDASPLGSAGMEMPFQMAADGSFQGAGAAPGLAVGPARRLRRPPAQPRRQGDAATEMRALVEALDRARREVQFARRSIAAQVGEEHAQMLDTHTALLDDVSLIEPTRERITSGSRAEEAWSTSIAEVAARFAAMEDGYLRARAEDVRDIGRRVLAQFSGTASGPATMRGAGILVARELGAAETATLDTSLVHGIAVATGSPTSHSAVLARALGVPAVVNVGEVIMSVSEDQDLLVDGHAGTVRIAPDPATVAEVRQRQEDERALAAEQEAAAHAPATTKDGATVTVDINIASVDTIDGDMASGADGVGLFRTEFLFVGRDHLPDEDEQVALYRRAAEAVAGRGLTIRTLDAGGDKPVPSLSPGAENNPFLGMRGIRLSLSTPDIFRTQLRAILRVAADHPITILFPMISTPEEIEAAREQLDLAREELAARGEPAGDVEVGAMIEVPSAALCADAIVPHVDMVSIGTNDLTQYALAAERGNASVDHLADPAHPAVLRLIATVSQAAGRANRRVGVCGDLAHDPALVPILIGLGVRELSVPVPHVGAVKDAVRNVHADDSTVAAAEILRLGSAEAVRAAAAGKCSGNCPGCSGLECATEN